MGEFLDPPSGIFPNGQDGQALLRHAGTQAILAFKVELPIA